ncbi:unnamed protein product [Cylicostephanus goldi]|uniref:Uncharacterized protein n=1 Tax=Cylicostephanus goldi TaxID=71465 RepID=A0A3P7NSJ5_CYLGO|nr:unnamed protein product [Cylicostephanus goldi]
MAEDEGLQLRPVEAENSNIITEAYSLVSILQTYLRISQGRVIMDSYFQKFRGVLFTSPLRVVKHVFEGEGLCRISLKVEWNSDMGPNQFENDVFGIIIDSNGKAVAVTNRHRENVSVLYLMQRIFP